MRAVRRLALPAVLLAGLAACAQLNGDPITTNSVNAQASRTSDLPPGTVLPPARPGETAEQRLARLEYDLAQLKLDYSIVRPSFEHLVSRERDLTDRIAHLEDVTGPITASIAPASPPPAKMAKADQAPPPAPAKPPAVASAAPDAPVGVHLASYRTRDKVEAGWMELVAAHPKELADLKVRVQRVDLGEKGVYERLIAGPLASADAASKLCKALESGGVYCKQMTFSGDPL